MGEVWRARDTRLAREVAIKVLQDDVAADHSRLKRFEKKARAASALNHPNIVTVYDIGTSDSFSWIAMERVEGKTLREMLAADRLSIKRTLNVAAQFADGLSKAHEAGIVHRDLKPENVMVTKDGLVKILDFGLAKLTQIDPIAEGSRLPTETGTQPGVVLGTVGYMSPEQASGQPVDFRSDQFSFGAILYEMVTGKRAFQKKTPVETLSAILTAEPEPIERLTPDAPAPLRWTVERCLAKEPEQRYASTKDLARDLPFLRDRLSDVSQTLAGVEPARAFPGARFGWIAGAVGVLALTAAVAFLGRARLRGTSTEPAPVRFLVAPTDGWEFPPYDSLTVGAKAQMAVSPSGQEIAYVAVSGEGTALLWIRSLDSLTARALPGTENASSPFWSPDSSALGFFAGGKLKKIDALGGPAVTLCDAPDNRGGSWSRDGTIVFAPSVSVATRLSSGLQKVSTSGGAPEPATVLGDGEASHVSPVFLPDGRHFLYRALLLGQAGAGPIYVASVDSKERKLLLNATSTNVVLSGGCLLFLRDAALIAQPFDVKRLQLSGEPRVVIDDVGSLGAPPLGIFSASENAVLVYERGFRFGRSEIAWFDRNGKKEPVLDDRADYGDVELSPDGTRAALTVLDQAQKARDIWICDLARRVRTRLTFDPAEENTPIWSPDGRRIVYSLRVSGTLELYEKASDGSGAPQVLLADHRNKFPACWSPDGRFILYMVDNGAPSGWDLWLLPLFGKGSRNPSYKRRSTRRRDAFHRTASGSPMSRTSPADTRRT